VIVQNTPKSEINSDLDPKALSTLSKVEKRKINYNKGGKDIKVANIIKKREQQREDEFERQKQRIIEKNELEKSMSPKKMSKSERRKMVEEDEEKMEQRCSDLNCRMVFNTQKRCPKHNDKLSCNPRFELVQGKFKEIES